jgi:hypothetical protein
MQKGQPTESIRIRRSPQAVLMTLFRTAELQNQNQLEAVLAIAKSTIEMPKSNVQEFKLAG